MKKFSFVLVLLVVVSFLGKTMVTSFCPDIVTGSIAMCDWEKESAGDESGEDDKAMQQLPATPSPGDSPSFNAVLHAAEPLAATLDIVAPPPQGRES